MPSFSHVKEFSPEQVSNSANSGTSEREGKDKPDSTVVGGRSAVFSAGVYPKPSLANSPPQPYFERDKAGKGKEKA